MFPSIKGEHFDLECPYCRYGFPIDANRIPSYRRAVCPNCGHDEVDFSTQDPANADRLILSKQTSGFRRWNIVAFRTEGLNIGRHRKQKYAVKRIVGLPGESISIAGGNVLVNGIVAVKPPDVQNQMLIHEFDSGFAAAGRNRDQPWDRLARDPAEKSDDAWLYQPIRAYQRNNDSLLAGGIEDSFGYNQNLPRKLNFAEEVKVSLGSIAAGSAAITLRFGRTAAFVAIDNGKRTLTSGTKQPTSNAPPPTRLDSPVNSIAISNLDQQLRIHAGHRLIKTEQLDVQPAGNDDRLQILISSSTDRTNLRLQIQRDVYYIGNRESDRISEAEWTLADDQYFVLGDNPPASIDSRHYGPISRRAIVGTVDPAAD